MTWGIVFDLDGTLVDSRQDIVDAVTFALDAVGAPPRTPQQIASYVGDGARMLLSRALGVPENDPRCDAALALFLDYYGRHGADHTTLMPRAAEALRALSEFPHAVCTNKPRATTELVLEHVGMASHFRVVVAGGDLPERKPHPRPLLHIAERLELPPERLFMVGDGPQDVECGRAAGARTIAVLGGFAEESVLRAASPDTVIAHLGELPELVFGAR